MGQPRVFLTGGGGTPRALQPAEGGTPLVWHVPAATSLLFDAADGTFDEFPGTFDEASQ